MVTHLTDRIIKIGEELLYHLDLKEVSIVAAFWMYSSSNGTWKLVFASPQVRQNGPKILYQFVQSKLLKYEDRPLSLSDVVIVNEKSNFVTPLRSAIRIEKGMLGTRFTDNYINGILFEDLYIYRVQ
jgi:hypothetical protein